MAKTIAFFLPQFHETKENNEWWGMGFTEWVNVKSAKPCYKSHKQPRVPLNDNYYNLLEKETMIWQTKLVNDAGLEGLCYYHYWFNGRLVLEKPAENLLKWKDIPQKFCFSWANESWKRTWDRREGNDWNKVIDQRMGKTVCKDKGMLLEQNYGGKEDWVRHFKYLLPFFKDERYITYSGHPVFIIYRPSKIACINEMLACWQELAELEGINSLYIISTNESTALSPYIQAKLCYEPRYTFSNGMPLKYWIREVFIRVLEKMHFFILRKFDYNCFIEVILNRKERKEKTFRGLFVGYDDTPRRGRNGVIFEGVSPEIFGKAYLQLLKEADNEDFVFITAWNEWAEGAYLEPDTLYGNRWLEVIKEAINESK